MPTLAEIADRVSARPIPEEDEAILIALARAEASLRVVLAAIAELKAEMNRPAPPTDVIPSPDDTWVGAVSG
jgi:hypothetical protein